MDSPDLTSGDLLNRLMNRMDVEIHCWKDASVDFITKMVMEGVSHPEVMFWKDGKIKSCLPQQMAPRMTIVSAVLQTRKYGTKDKCQSVPVWSLVLMDGSKCLIKAVTNSGLSFLLEGKELVEGMTIILKDYRPVDMVTGNDCQWKRCLLIQNMDWRPAPDQAAPGHVFVDPAVHLIEDDEYDDRQYVRLDKGWIDTVAHTGLISFSHAYNDPSDNALMQVRYTGVHAKRFSEGAWIQLPQLRDDWEKFAERVLPANKKLIVDPMHQIPGRSPPSSPKSPDKKKARTNADEDDDDSGAPGVAHCQCVMDFGLLTCVTESFPSWSLDFDQILYSCQRRLHGEIEAERFCDLPSKHKRWCLYWWYAVNIYQIRGSAQPLPSCLVNTIRNEFPNSEGVAYTGFKSSVERAAQEDV